MTNSKEILSKNIQYLLKKNNLSREEVARVLGVKYTTFCDWVKGRTYPKMDYITKLANYLMVTTNALVDENPDYERAIDDAMSVQSDINSYDVFTHKIIVAWTGYTTDGDYLIQNKKNEDIIFRSIKIENDDVTMYVLNPTNKKHIITKYFKKDDFFSKYTLLGKVKKLERVFEGY